MLHEASQSGDVFSTVCTCQDSSRAGLKCGTNIVELAYVRIRQANDKRSAIRLLANQTFRTQELQSLAHGRAADTHFRGETRLDQPVSGFHPAGQNLLADKCSSLGREGWVCHDCLHCRQHTVDRVPRQGPPRY